jgi:PAS domain-containing protein
VGTTLIVTDGSSTREVPLDGPVVVGRDPLCTVYVDDPLLSRKHAEFMRTSIGVRVRDLHSQNGVRVNGIAVQELVLQHGDVVEMASLTMRVVEQGDVEAQVEDTTAQGEGTVVMTHPPTAHVSAPQPPSPDDGTVLVTRAPAAQAPASPPAAAPREPASDGRARRRRSDRRLPWTARVVLTSSLMAALIVGAAVVPAMWWHQRQIAAAANLRATTLVDWLAAETGRHLQAGRPVTAVTNDLLDQPGVTDVLVVALDGRVLAPASRRGETIRVFPALGMAPASVNTQHVRRSEGYVHAVRPTAAGGSSPAAIVWLSLRQAHSGTSLALVALPVLLLAGLAGGGGGWMVCRRMTRALAVLNDDVEALLAGELTKIDDLLRTKPTKELVETMNYVVTRLRASTKGDLRRVRRNTPAGDAPAPGEGQSPVPSVEAPSDVCLVASPHFRIVEASPGCEALLGLKIEQLVGQHLLDALPDAALVDAILQCLGESPAIGEAERHATCQAGRVRVLVNRSGKEAPLTIHLRAEEARLS